MKQINNMKHINLKYGYEDLNILPEFNEGQLVLVNHIADINTGKLLSTNYHYNYDKSVQRNFNFRKFATWIRVKFIDNDNTFVGEVERVEKNRWTDTDILIYEKGQQVILGCNRVYAIEDTNKDFCYSDDVTQCSCPGLCRNK